MKKFKSGTYQKHFTGTEAEYKTFLPESLFQDFTFEQKDSILLLEEANRLIGEINVYSKLIPDVDFFIAMHVNQEAVSSSKIEGTKMSISQIVLILLINGIFLRNWISGILLKTKCIDTILINNKLNLINKIN